ncbi:MAG TPA: T9SS type A sorting domain-containing protein, partial [Chitinophagaceae bacterium]
IADTLKKNGQDFSSSFQVKWSFRSRGRATDNMGGYGLVLDDINLYEAINDMQLLAIDTPANISCGLSGNTPLKIKIRNSSNSALSGVPVRYSVNGGAWVVETIATIAANTTLEYTFNTPLNFSASGLYAIRTLVDYPGDNYRLNDTLSVSVHNAPLVKTYPYLENFEAGDGGWYTIGSNSSWAYGTPASPRINKAASGTKAWKTNLSGNYNDAEYSYLYSPCFEVGSMTNPMLSFSMAMELENCGSTMCDAAWVEYSTDNKFWYRLTDSAAAGTNWYTTTPPAYWSNQNYSRWHAVTMGLPRGVSNLRLRIVMWSDEAINMEGIAIDDIHIYDSVKAIYNGPSPSMTSTQPVSGTGWVHFESEGKLIASIKSNGQNLGATEVQGYIHSGSVRNTNKQYYHNRNITIKPQTTSLSDSVSVRMYFPDSESEALVAATGCSDCAKPGSAYELGVSKYSDPDDSKENGEICDNARANNWSFTWGRNVAVVPFQKGYYIEFKVKDFSEFWLNNGGANGQTPLASVQIPALAAVCVGAAEVALSAAPLGGTWSGVGVNGGTFNPAQAGAGTHTLSYTYAGTDGCNAVATVSITVNPLPVIAIPDLAPISINGAAVSLSGAQPAGGTWSGPGVTNGVFSPATAGIGTHTLTYSYTDTKGCSAQATTSITVNPIAVKLITFIADRKGMEDVQANWTTEEETTILRYELELARGDEALAGGQFVKIGEVVARRSNAPREQYTFIDTEPVKTGKRHYRLKLLSADGSFTYSDTRMVEFPASTWTVYPNPSPGKFYMLYQAAPSEHLEANVYDTRGRLVKQYRRQGSGAVQRLEVDLSPATFAPGIYMLQTVVNGRKEFFKLHKL